MIREIDLERIRHERWLLAMAARQQLGHWLRGIYPEILNGHPEVIIGNSQDPG